jgi:hypothetical protein
MTYFVSGNHNFLGDTKITTMTIFIESAHHIVRRINHVPDGIDHYRKDPLSYCWMQDLKSDNVK